jgi:hypothetical protein
MAQQVNTVWESQWIIGKKTWPKFKDTTYQPFNTNKLQDVNELSYHESSQHILYDFKRMASLDFSFPGPYLYGLPHRPDSFLLKTTEDTEPI